MLKYLKSTIVLKVVMALTGLIIVGFLFGHAIGNLQFFLGADVYNSYADFLQGLGEILWLIRGGLFVCIILHIISAVYLRIYNNAAKPTHYKVKNYVKAKLTSRTMLWTGLLIVAGVTFHLLHFTAGTIDFNGGYDNYELHQTGEYIVAAGSGGNSNACNSAKKTDCSGEHHSTAKKVASCNDCSSSDGEMCAKCKENPEGCSKNKNVAANHSHSDCSGCSAANNSSLKPVVKERHDVYAMVGIEFGNIWVALSYIIFVSLVGFHLNHAIQSAVHTIGIEGPKFTPFMRVASIVLSIILVLLFIILPLSVVADTLLGCGCLGGF